ncbi:unnamed protein product [Calypogeia fissa]
MMDGWRRARRTVDSKQSTKLLATILLVAVLLQLVSSVACTSRSLQSLEGKEKAISEPDLDSPMLPELISSHQAAHERDLLQDTPSGEDALLHGARAPMWMPITITPCSQC